MNQKPKILIFSVFFDPVEGGAEIALRQLISELADAYDFHIITARLSKYAVAYEQRSYATIHRVGTGRFTIDKYFYTYFAKRHVRKFFVDGGIVFDMVYGLLENQAALVALDIGRKHKKPILIGLQSGDTEKEIRRFLGPFSFLYDKVYSKDAQYAVLSTYLRQRALSHGVSQERIHVIPNGVNISVFTKKPDATEVAKIKRDLHLEPFTIVTTSRLVKKNAIDDLIRAFVIVREKIPQSTLLICGGGPDEHSLRELAHSLGVSTHVRFVKHIRLEELPLYLAASTVFVRASRSEGFGNSFIEAMAFGIPVVATRVGGIADFLTTKTGFECEVNNPNSIANAIFSLLSEPKQTAAIVKNAKSFVVSEYDWKKVSKKYDALFKEMLR